MFPLAWMCQPSSSLSRLRASLLTFMAQTTQDDALHRMQPTLAINSLWHRVRFWHRTQSTVESAAIRHQGSGRGLLQPGDGHSLSHPNHKRIQASLSSLLFTGSHLTVSNASIRCKQRSGLGGQASQLQQPQMHCFTFHFMRFTTR